MTIPVWILLAFAVWTLLILMVGVATYRWKSILFGEASFDSYAEYEVSGDAWHKRGMRAHANCVEFLPVYAGITVAIYAAGLDTTTLDVLAIVFFIGRILHSLVHLLFEQTNIVVAFRSLFTHVEVFAMLGMAGVVAFSVW